jgi:hypothetical protein
MMADIGEGEAVDHEEFVETWEWVQCLDDAHVFVDIGRAPVADEVPAYEPIGLVGDHSRREDGVVEWLVGGGEDAEPWPDLTESFFY